MKWVIRVIVMVSFLLARPVFAAELFFGAPAEALPVGQQTAIGVFVNTDAQTVNAFEGRVIVPAGLVIQDVDLADSFVTLWIESPHVDGPCSETCEIAFSGIIPGGYTTPNGQLFAIRVVPASGLGDWTVSAKDVRILLNDGHGTDAPVRVSPITLHRASALPSVASFASSQKYGILFVILLVVIGAFFLSRRVWGFKK